MMRRPPMDVLKGAAFVFVRGVPAPLRLYVVEMMDGTVPVVLRP